MKQEKRKNLNKGFTIVELSVVLTVIALIAGSALSVASSRIEAAKIKATNERMEFIMESLDLFIRKFCYLPCPADGSLLVEDNDFGMGTGTGTVGPGNCAAENAGDLSTNVLVGILPTKTLQIAHTMALDGWNRRFTYVVDEDMTWQAGYLVNNGEIVVKRTALAGSSEDITQQAAVLIISHGTNGHGAWKGKGVDRLDKDTTDADEVENSWDGDGVSESPAEVFDSIFVQKFRTSTFEDIVLYKLKWQLPDC